MGVYEIVTTCDVEEGD